MKTGDSIEVRPAGAESWVTCRVDVASANGVSLALSADEGLPVFGLSFHPVTKRWCQVLLLLRKEDGYACVFTGRRYELREGVQQKRDSGGS